MTALLPRARLRDVALRRAHLLGSRLSEDAPRGVFSPVEARVHLGIDYDDLVEEEARLLGAGSARGRLGLLARAMLARLIGGAGGEAKAVSIFGIEPAALSVPAALDCVFATGHGDARVIHFAHPHALNVSLVDDDLHQQLRDADVVFGDGIGVRIGTRMLGGALPANLNGTDMLPLICRRAAAEQRPVVLIGARPEVVEACAERLRAAHPGLDIPLVSHGYLDDAQSRTLACEIAALSAPIVLVGMGTPIQERWVWQHRRHMGGATVLTVGGLFDFYSGRIPRAPAALRELGLEWLYRMWQEPRRMARRYLLGNPLFLLMIASQRLRLAPRRLARLTGTARLLGVRRRRALPAGEAAVLR